MLFNKDVAGFSGVQATTDVSIRAHPKFLRAIDAGLADEWRFVFQSQEDAGREVSVRVFIFNLYRVPERAAKMRQSTVEQRCSRSGSSTALPQLNSLCAIRLWAKGL